MSDQDKALFSRICKKDQLAFEQLYIAHHRKLLILAYKYVKDEEQAEEIVNDVFLKIWTNASQLNIAYSLSAYLSRSVANRCLNVIREQKRMTIKLEKYQADTTELYDEDEAVILEERLLKLEKVLDTLPPQCKKIIMMSKFEKCKQQDIADRLNISIKTVKNQLTIGYEKIRNAIIISIILIMSLAYLGLFNNI